MVALGIELSATRLSAEYGQPALDYRFQVHQVVSSPYGNRTHLAALKGRYPVSIDERAVFMLCALTERKVGREALESSSAVLQTAADQRKRRCPRLSYQPKLSFG